MKIASQLGVRRMASPAVLVYLQRNVCTSRREDSVDADMLLAPSSTIPVHIFFEISITLNRRID